MNWLNLCNSISQNSKCLSRKVGSIIVKNDKYIISSGYNGPPVGSPHCSDVKYRGKIYNLFYEEHPTLEYNQFTGSLDDITICPRRKLGFKSSEGLEYCHSAHSERNSIDMAARLGVSVEGMTMYMNCGIPCMECSKSIVNSGIKEIVVANLDVYEKRGITGLDILVEGKVKIRKFNE